MGSINSVVLYSTTRLYDGDSASSSRMTKYAKALANECKVYFFSVLDSDISMDVVHEVKKNIFVVGKEKRYWNKITRRLNYPFKIIMFVRNMNKLMERLDKNAVFILYPSMTIFLDIVTILYLIKFKKKKVFLEINEVRQYDPIFFSDPESLTFRQSLIFYLRKKKYIFNEELSKYFKGLICISTNIKKYYSNYNKNSIRIPILCDDFVENKRGKKTYNPEEKFLIGFTGWISFRKENLDLFFESLISLKKWFNNFEVHLYGPINDNVQNELNKIVKDFGLSENIIYKGEVSQKELPSILKKFHLLILPRGFNLQNHYGFSTKLSEYLVSGVPTLSTRVSDNALYIKDNVNGFIVTPDSKTEITNKLKFIIHNYNKIVPQIVENANKTVKKYFLYSNYSNVLKEFLCLKK